MNWNDILKGFNWKKILLTVWEDLLPALEKKVADTASKWDDVALDAVKVLVEKFLKEDEPVAEEVKSVE